MEVMEKVPREQPELKGLEKPHLLKWVGKPVHLRSYFNHYLSLIPKEVMKSLNSGPRKPIHNNVLSLMGVDLSKNDLKDLESICQDKELDVEGEPPKYSECSAQGIAFSQRTFGRFFKMPSADVCSLSTLRELRQRENSPVFLKYSTTLETVPSLPKNEKKFLPLGKDFLIFVKIYKPFECREKHVCSAHPLTEEFAVLGSQTLASLKDCITCPNDWAGVDISENPYKQTVKKAKDLIKSGFFFINNNFYNDYRVHDNIDYSEVIRDWAEKKGIDSLSHASMVDTCFEDLTVRFGYPYAYLHQGNCEHLVVFSDARLPEWTDPANQNAYPMKVSTGIAKKQLCLICRVLVARYVTVENEAAPLDPMYYCTDCFERHNYVNGKKVGKFKAYEMHV